MEWTEAIERSHFPDTAAESTAPGVTQAFGSLKGKVVLAQPNDGYFYLHPVFGGDKMPIAAALWWRHQAHWCFELQRKTPFRQSGKDEEFVLYLEDELDEPLFHKVAESGELALVEQSRFARIEIELGAGVEAWLANDVKRQLEKIAELKEMTLADASKRFAQLRLRETEKRRAYHP